MVEREHQHNGISESIAEMIRGRILAQDQPKEGVQLLRSNARLTSLQLLAKIKVQKVLQQDSTTPYRAAMYITSAETYGSAASDPVKKNIGSEQFAKCIAWVTTNSKSILDKARAGSMSVNQERMCGRS
jgi:hypothetical protein